MECGSGIGGLGGGIIHLNVSGILELNGDIDVSGTNGTMMAGSGAGGSIFIAVDILKGYFIKMI